MKVPKDIACCSPGLFILIVSICLFNATSQHTVDRFESKSFERTMELVWFTSRRVRRSSTHRVCSGNRTTFVYDGNSCFYDHACFKIFSDCCWDYPLLCGRQDLTKTTDIKELVSAWKCVKFSSSLGLQCSINGVTGFWMISKCPASETFKGIKAKCEDAPTEFSYPVEVFIPVVGANALTYRNKYCALCNGMETYTSWDMRVDTYVVPPEGYDLNKQLKFILENGGRIGLFSPHEDQPRRYCYGLNYIDTCDNITNQHYERCVEGPIAVVTNKEYQYFKNLECASCNGYPDLLKWHMAGICGRPASEKFSIVFKLKGTREEASTTSVISKLCPSGSVYDTSLKFCRKGYAVYSDNRLANEFLILLWLKHPRSGWKLNSTFKSWLRTAFTSQFSLQPNQISEVTFHKQYKTNIFFVASVRLTLTPFQSLVMANPNEPNLNTTWKNIAFLRLLNLTGNFTLVWDGYSVSVVKVVSKQLSCYGEEKSHEQDIDRENGTFLGNKTGEQLLLDDYTIVKEEGGNVTLCRKLVLSDCTEGSYVPLAPKEYVTFPNLSIYYKASNSTFYFGEYLISESLNKEHNNLTTQNLRNTTIAICLPFKNTFNKTDIKFKKSSTSYALGILTAIGFSISISCLVLLLTTYGLFKELRTVPGLNLMNLSFSMFLSQFIWLIGTSHFTGTTTCKAFAIVGHYLLQASFLAMSVISHHTCLTLSNPFIGRIANKSWRRFLVYSAFVWFIPAIVVAICVSLDETEVFPVDYGTNCWMGTVNAKLYLFLLPLGILLLYNICRFIQTARGLSRHDKDRKMLQQKKGKQNLLICTKIATLVGFPWLFAFFGVLFPDVEVFEYLFVIFVCLQGLYIGMAFLFNKKTMKLYIDRWNAFLTSRENSSSQATGALTFEMT